MGSLMSVNKNFEYETGYYGEDGIPETVKEYMKATGKTVEEVAKEIVDSNLSNEPKQEVVEPETAVETEEVDEGPGLLKRIGLGIMDIPKSVSDWRDTHDDMWRVGLVNAMFGDNSTLNNWYANQNAMKEAEKNREFQAEQARLNRESQQEYNTMFKQLEEANQRKEQMAIDRKRALEILKLGEGASAIEKLELEQILSKYDNDALGIEDLRSRAGAQSSADLVYAKFKGKMPRGEAKQDEWDKWLTEGEELFADDPTKLLEIQNAYNSRGKTAEEERREYGKGQARKAGEEASAEEKEKNKRRKEIKNKIAALKKDKDNAKTYSEKYKIQKEIDKLNAELSGI